MSIAPRQLSQTDDELCISKDVFESANTIMEANPMHTILAIEATRNQGRIDITLQKPDLLRILGAVDYLTFFRLRNLNHRGQVPADTQRLTKATKTEFHKEIDPNQPIQYNTHILGLSTTSSGKQKATSIATLLQEDDLLATTTGTFIGISGGPTLKQKLTEALQKTPNSIKQKYANLQDKDMRDVVCPDNELTNGHDGPAAMAYLDPHDPVRKNSKGLQHGGWLTDFAAMYLGDPVRGTQIEVVLCRLKEGDQIFLFKENPIYPTEMSNCYTDVYTIRDLSDQNDPILRLKANYPLDLRRNLAK